VTAWYAGQGGNSPLTGIPSSHLHRLMISDDVLIQFDLMMNAVMLETCKVKLKQSRYRPEVAQSVPGS